MSSGAAFMAAEKQLTMLQSACQKLRISRSRDLTLLVVDGQGAALVPTQDFMAAEQWAKAKTAAPNAMQSLAKVMEKLDNVITRPGTTFASTRGTTKALENLVRAMKSAGYDLKEFAVPLELLKPAADPMAKPRPKADAPKPVSRPEPEPPPGEASHIMDFRK
jgi:hypothetical protein